MLASLQFTQKIHESKLHPYIYNALQCHQDVVRNHWESAIGSQGSFCRLPTRSNTSKSRGRLNLEAFHKEIHQNTVEKHGNTTLINQYKS